MTTKEVCEKTNTTIQTAARWAKANGVKVEQVKGRMLMGYVWTEADVERFLNRRKAGRQLGTKLPNTKPKPLKNRRISFSAEELNSALESIKNKK